MRATGDDAKMVALMNARIATLEAERDKFKVALDKINVIRNSIIGVQGFNFSEHAYPLVAALNAAGFEGMPYGEARAYVGSMLERTVKAEDRATTLEADLKRAREEVAYLRAHREWGALASVADLSDDCRRRVVAGAEIGMCPACKEWLAANPEPVPPSGVKP
jgi:hypothetical protein